ncbi:RES family NAD+ phosphorylase [Kitasatospora sp. NPDC058032]|uniref:RES family NAD+ phosphorylase n=1 Tax=unclassified Kitasatospora TaxID=2633591 RepID=UPI0033A2350E
MPRYPCPDSLPGEPIRAVLAAGTTLYRVHSTHRSPVAFNSVPAKALYDGGRFDGTPNDEYGFLYAGFGPGAALCEVLLRSIPFDASGGPRLLQRAAFERRSLSVLRLRESVQAVSLMSGTELAAVGQDSWLIHAEGLEYPQTRDWGHWIRERTKTWSQGFVWPSKREPADRVVVLFEDRCGDAPLEPTGHTVDFGTEEGEEWLNAALSPYLTRTSPKQPGRWL